MDSIGEKLRSVRESKKLTIRDVAKDTNISSLYLQALEDEDFDKFPGETYIIGFIRSYAEYLKLNSEEIIQSYKGYKIGESVTPLEELTKPTGSLIPVDFGNMYQKYKGYLNLVAIGAIIAVVILLFSLIPSTTVNIEDNNSITQLKNEYKSKNTETSYEKIVNVNFTNDKGAVLTYKNEAIQFMVDTKELMYVLSDIKPNSVKLLSLPDKKEILLEIDKPYSEKIDGVERNVTFQLSALTANRAKIFIMLGQKVAKVQPKVEEKQVENKATDSTNVLARNDQNLKIIFEANFLGKTYIELYIDGQKKTSGMMQAGVYKRWEANQAIQMKIGNAGGLKAKINGKNYTFGRIGQIANKVIKWKKDIKNPNLYHIVVKDW